MYGEPQRERKPVTPPRLRVPWHRLPFALWQHYCIAREHGAGRVASVRRLAVLVKLLRKAG